MVKTTARYLIVKVSVSEEEAAPFQTMADTEDRALAYVFRRAALRSLELEQRVRELEDEVRRLRAA